MKYTLDWLVNPEVFAVNRIAAHSDHKFYANLNEANSNISSLIQNLNGTWKFTWAKNPIEWKSDFYKENNRTDNFDNIMVPGDTEIHSMSIQFIRGKDGKISVRRLFPKRITLSAATSDILTSTMP